MRRTGWPAQPRPTEQRHDDLLGFPSCAHPLQLPMQLWNSVRRCALALWLRRLAGSAQVWGRSRFLGFSARGCVACSVPSLLVAARRKPVVCSGIPFLQASAWPSWVPLSCASSAHWRTSRAKQPTARRVPLQRSPPPSLLPSSTRSEQCPTCWRAAPCAEWRRRHRRALPSEAAEMVSQRRGPWPRAAAARFSHGSRSRLRPRSPQGERKKIGTCLALRLLAQRSGISGGPRPQASCSATPVGNTASPRPHSKPQAKGGVDLCTGLAAPPPYQQTPSLESS
mmetsp:Transcript_108368/g.305585  ORF Transcript_108368/g.305585 Transcript_108368/m.305585 type:complete len:282 (-) Transcript_108368:1130-1975(-)